MPTAATIGYHSSLRIKLTLTMGRRRYRSPQRMAAPTLQPLIPQEEGAGGCRKGAEIRTHPRGSRAKVFSGGRPSAGEVPHSLPPAEDPWSSGEPLATALPHRAASWFPVVADGTRVWRKAGPLFGDMKQGQYL